MTEDPSDRSTLAAYQTNSTPNGYPAKTASARLPSHSLYNVCHDIREKVDSFLAEDPKTALLRSVQARVREALAVVDETFKRYEYVLILPWPFCLDNLLTHLHAGPKRYLYHITEERTVCESVALP
jgi:hypothetical protein